MVTNHVPVKRVCQFSRNWWTPDIKILHERMRQAARHWQKKRILHFRANYLQLDNFSGQQFEGVKGFNGGCGALHLLEPTHGSY